MNPLPVATDGLSLWNLLKTETGLDLRRRDNAPYGYDVPLEERLNELLFQNPIASLQQNLRAAPPSAEDFLAAFFKAQRPFAMMVSDVLQLFEAASAQYGTHNLKVVFNFEKAKRLELDLEQFREWDRFLQSVVHERSVWAWTPETLWPLTYALNRLLGYDYPSAVPMPQDPAVRRFIELRAEPEWQDLPPFPRSGELAFDQLLDRCERLLSAYRAACRALAPDRTSFLEIGGRSYSGLRSPEPQTAAEARQVYNLYQPETDLWASTFLHALTAAAEEISAGKKHVTPEFLTDFSSQLDALDEGVERVQEWQDMLRELLNLPIWQRRHELYAVWVGSRIADALNDIDAVFHAEGGVLEFPFSGAHLATFTIPRPAAFMFWTELRTPLAVKTASGRRNIQPDYRMVRLPYLPVANTVLIVECKQYRRSSTHEFSNALNDYAAGCANARVILVNNGPIGASVYTSIMPEYAGRTEAIAHFRPDNPETTGQFRALVRSVIVGDDTAAPEHDPANAGDALAAIRLDWGADLSDLDLIVLCKSREGDAASCIISYQNPGDLSVWPWLHLDGDVRSGPGTEIVRTAQWANAVYDIYVHNYSHTQSPARAGVMVTVHHPRHRTPQQIDGADFPGGHGRYWHVCSVDGLSGSVNIVGLFRDQLE
jgi:hypothetical protein